MLQIHAMAENNPILGQYATLFAFGTTTEILKLIISCLINGLVYEENDKLYAVLDNINPKDIDEDEYKELLLFKIMSRETKFGFTIGGFAPLKKTTLLSVNQKSLFFESLLKILSVNFFIYSFQILSFILNYTVIIVQTAKH
jgi:hypothetical protein